MTKAQSLDRKLLLNPRPGADQQSWNIYFTTQCSNMAYDIRCIITKNWDILLSDPTFCSAFPEPPSFAFSTAFKRLLQQETFWIHTLRATSFPGLNGLSPLLINSFPLPRDTICRFSPYFHNVFILFYTFWPVIFFSCLLGCYLTMLWCYAWLFLERCLHTYAVSKVVYYHYDTLLKLLSKDIDIIFLGFCFLK